MNSQNPFHNLPQENAEQPQPQPEPQPQPAPAAVTPLQALRFPVDKAAAVWFTVCMMIPIANLFACYFLYCLIPTLHNGSYEDAARIQKNITTTAKIGLAVYVVWLVFACLMGLLGALA